MARRALDSAECAESTRSRSPCVLHIPLSLSLPPPERSSSLSSSSSHHSPVPPFVSCQLSTVHRSRLTIASALNIRCSEQSQFMFKCTRYSLLHAHTRSLLSKHFSTLGVLYNAFKCLFSALALSSEILLCMCLCVCVFVCVHTHMYRMVCFMFSL